MDKSAKNFPMSAYSFNENSEIYSLAEERRDWRKKIEKQIEDAKEEIKDNDDANEAKVESKIEVSENNITSNSNTKKGGD
jgi:hypothetical protein